MTNTLAYHDVLFKTTRDTFIVLSCSNLYQEKETLLKVIENCALFHSVQISLTALSNPSINKLGIFYNSCNCKCVYLYILLFAVNEFVNSCNVVYNCK